MTGTYFYTYMSPNYTPRIKLVTPVILLERRKKKVQLFSRATDRFDSFIDAQHPNFMGQKCIESGS